MPNPGTPRRRGTGRREIDRQSTQGKGNESDSDVEFMGVTPPRRRKAESEEDEIECWVKPAYTASTSSSGVKLTPTKKSRRESEEERRNDKAQVNREGNRQAVIEVIDVDGDGTLTASKEDKVLARGAKIDRSNEANTVPDERVCGSTEACTHAFSSVQLASVGKAGGRRAKGGLGSTLLGERGLARSSTLRSKVDNGHMEDVDGANTNQDSGEGRSERAKDRMNRIGKKSELLDNMDEYSNDEVDQWIFNSPNRLYSMPNTRGEGYDVKKVWTVMAKDPQECSLCFMGIKPGDFIVKDDNVERAVWKHVNCAREQGYFEGRGYRLTACGNLVELHTPSPQVRPVTTPCVELPSLAGTMPIKGLPMGSETASITNTRGLQTPPPVERTRMSVPKPCKALTPEQRMRATCMQEMAGMKKTISELHKILKVNEGSTVNGAQVQETQQVERKDAPSIKKQSVDHGTRCGHPKKPGAGGYRNPYESASRTRTNQWISELSEVTPRSQKSEDIGIPTKARLGEPSGRNQGQPKSTSGFPNSKEQSWRRSHPEGRAIGMPQLLHQVLGGTGNHNGGTRELPKIKEQFATTDSEAESSKKSRGDRGLPNSVGDTEATTRDRKEWLSITKNFASASDFLGISKPTSGKNAVPKSKEHTAADGAVATSSKTRGGDCSLPKSKEGSPTKSSMGDTGAPVESENGLPTSEKSLLTRKDHKFRAASTVRGTGDANGSKHAFPKNTRHITMTGVTVDGSKGENTAESQPGASGRCPIHRNDMSGIDKQQVSDAMQRFDADEASYKQALCLLTRVLGITVDNDHVLQPSGFGPISRHNFDETIYDVLGEEGWSASKFNEYLEREFGGEDVAGPLGTHGTRIVHPKSDEGNGNSNSLDGTNDAGRGGEGCSKREVKTVAASTDKSGGYNMDRRGVYNMAATIPCTIITGVPTDRSQTTNVQQSNSGGPRDISLTPEQEARMKRNMECALKNSMKATKKDTTSGTMGPLGNGERGPQKRDGGKEAMNAMPQSEDEGGDTTSDDDYEENSFLVDEGSDAEVIKHNEKDEDYEPEMSLTDKVQNGAVRFERNDDDQISVEQLEFSADKESFSDDGSYDSMESNESKSEEDDLGRDVQPVRRSTRTNRGRKPAYKEVPDSGGSDGERMLDDYSDDEHNGGSNGFGVDEDDDAVIYSEDEYVKRKNDENLDTVQGARSLPAETQMRDMFVACAPEETSGDEDEGKMPDGPVYCYGVREPNESPVGGIHSGGQIEQIMDGEDDNDRTGNTNGERVNDNERRPERGNGSTSGDERMTDTAQENGNDVEASLATNGLTNGGAKTVQTTVPQCHPFHVLTQK